MARKKKENYAEKAKAAVQSLKQAGSTIKTDALRKTPESAKTRQIIQKDKETRTAKAEQRRQQTIKSAKKTTDALREQKRAKQAEARRQQTIKSARQTAKDVVKSKARASLPSVKQAAETAKSAVGGVLKAHEERKTAAQPAKTMRETLKTIGGTARTAHGAAGGKGFAGKTGKMIDTAVITVRAAGQDEKKKALQTITKGFETDFERVGKTLETVQKSEKERRKVQKKHQEAEEKRQKREEESRRWQEARKIGQIKAKWADEIKAGTVFRTGAENMGKVAKKAAETIEIARGQEAKRQEDIASGAITPETVLEDMARRSNRWAILQNAKNTTGTNDTGKKQIRHLNTQQEELHRQNALDAAQFGLVFNPGSGKWEFGQDYEQAGQEVYDTSLHPSSPETVRTHFKNRIQQVPGDVVRQASDPGMLENFQQAHGGELPKTPIMLPKTPQEIAQMREAARNRAALPSYALAHNTAAGLAGIANAAYSTLDFFLPDPITPKFVQDYIDKAKQTNSDIKEQVTAWDYEHGGAVGGFVGSTYQSFVEMLPQAVAALMTGGGSAAGTGLQYAGGISNTAFRALDNAAKNPAYWLSFLQVAGPEYERKKKEGMDDLSAATSALISALGQAGIEMGGGLETMTESGKTGLELVGKTALEEGGEEVAQDIFSGMTDKGLYDGVRPVLGTEGETVGKSVFGMGDANALINPQRMASEFAAGALLGGIAGGTKILPAAHQMNVQQKLNPDIRIELHPWDTVTYKGMPGTVLRTSEDGSATVRVQDTETGKYKNVEINPREVRQVLTDKLFGNAGQSSFVSLPMFDGQGRRIDQKNAQPQTVNQLQTAQEQYEAQIDGVFDGSLPERQMILIGETPEILRSLGAPDLPLIMTQRVARKIAYPENYPGGGKHNIGIPALKQLPQQLSDPLAVLISKTQPDSFVILTKWQDTHNDPVIAAIHLNKRGVIEDINALASAYGKPNIKAILGANNENVVYTKQNKSINEVLVDRLQLPAAPNNDTLVAHSIAQGVTDVNSEMAQNLNDVHETMLERAAVRDEIQARKQQEMRRRDDVKRRWAQEISGLQLYEHVQMNGYSGLVTEFTKDCKVVVRFYDTKSGQVFDQTIEPEKAATLQRNKPTQQQNVILPPVFDEQGRRIDRNNPQAPQAGGQNTAQGVILPPAFDEQGRRIDRNAQTPQVAAIQPDSQTLGQAAQPEAETAPQVQTADAGTTQQEGQQTEAQPKELFPVRIVEDENGQVEMRGDPTARYQQAKKQWDEVRRMMQRRANDAAGQQTGTDGQQQTQDLTQSQVEDGIGKAEQEEAMQRVKQDEIEIVKDAWEDVRAAERLTGNYFDTIAKKGVTFTTKDNKIIQSIVLTGEMELAAKADNPVEVREYARLKLDEQEARKPIRQYNARHHAAQVNHALEIAETIIEFAKDKPGPLYNLNTLERNIYDIFGKEHQAEAQAFIDEYVTPVHKSVAKMTKMINESKRLVKALKIDEHESAIIQYILEEETDGALKYIKDNKIKMTDKREKKLEDAADLLRKMYADIFAEIQRVQIENGIEPTAGLKNYSPHLVKEIPDTRLGRAAYLLGIKLGGEDVLPTDLAGVTEMFRPGKPFFGNLEHRQGTHTVYDAIKGFDQYIEHAADVIYMTEHIQKFRAIEDALRYRLSDDGTKQVIDNIQNNYEMDTLQKREEIEKAYEKADFGMRGLVTELRRYADSLANKKSRGDRGIEDFMGRIIYEVSRKTESRIASNLTGFNLSTMITNVMPILQSFGEVDAGSVVAGVKDAALNFVSDDGFADASAFLTGRRSIEQLSRTATERLRDAGSMGMSFADWFTSNAVVRARTKQNMKHGMSFDAAVDEADSFAASLMADRSKGSMPGVFELRNPIVRLFTMFQLEVNNQIGYYTKDLPRRVGQGKGKAFAAAAIAGALAKSFTALFLYNEVTERLTGRRAALDPIGTLCTALGIDPAGQLLQKLGIGEAEKDERTTSERLRAAGKEIVGQVPFIGGVTGGGRVPVGAALPRSFTTKEMIKPLIYLVPPTGGGAIKKAVEGIATVRAGGAYDTDKDGRRQLLFPQYGQDFSDYALAAAFGKYRSKEAREYVEGGFQRLNADETAAYEYLIKDKQAGKVIGSPTELKETEPITTPRITSGLDPRQSYEAVKKLGADGAKDYKKLIECGISHETALDALQKLKEVKADWERKAPGEPGSGWDGLPEFEDKYIMSGEDEETVENTKKKDLEMRKNRVIMDLDISAADKALIKWVVGVDKPIDFSSEDAFAITSALAEKDQKDALALYHDDGFSAEQAIKYGGLVPDAVQDGEDSYSIKINAWDTIRNAKDLTDAQKDAAMEKIILPSLGAKWRSAAADKFIGDISATEKAYFAIAMQQIDKSVDNDITIHEADKREYKKLRKAEFIQELGLPVEKSGEMIKEGMTFGQREMLTWFMSADNGDLKQTWDDCINGKSAALRETAPALQESGLDVDLYKVIKAGLGRFSGDKDSKGESIPYSRRNKRIAYLDQWEGLTTSQKVLIMKSIDDKYEYGSSGSKKSGKGKGKSGRKPGRSKGSSAASGMMSGWQTMK